MLGAPFERRAAHQLVEIGVFLVEQHEARFIELPKEIGSGNFVELLVFRARRIGKHHANDPDRVVVMGALCGSRSAAVPFSPTAYLVVIVDDFAIAASFGP